MMEKERKRGREKEKIEDLLLFDLFLFRAMLGVMPLSVTLK